MIPTPRTFRLERDRDATGISGTGTVAEGVEFSDGTVAIRWIVGDDRSTVVWNSIGSVYRIHGHGGDTRIVFDYQTSDRHDLIAAEREPLQRLLDHYGSQNKPIPLNAIRQLLGNEVDHG